MARTTKAAQAERETELEWMRKHLQPSADADHMVRLFRADLGGDPRGPCLRLLIEGERGDGWDADNEGTGSYTVY